MLTALLVILILLWFAGYVRINELPLPDLTLFHLNNQEITLWNVLTLMVLAAIVGALPSPFRQIAGVFLILWVLSVLGIIAIAGSASIITLAIILGLLVYILGGF